MPKIRLNQYFFLEEFICPCCKTVKLSPLLLQKLTRFRFLVNRPVILNSGYRCPFENTRVNGDLNSYHMKGMAADIYVADIYLDNLFSVAKEVGFTGIGYYSKKNFLHLDVRPGKQKIWKDPPDQ